MNPGRMHRRLSPHQLPLPLRWVESKTLDVSPFERGPVVQTLRQLNRRAGPVTAPVLADFLGKSERTARLYLSRLEQAGMVQRPAGPRSGWVAV